MIARWLRGGLWIEVDGDGILVDAPTGVAEALGADLAKLRAIVTTTGRARSVAGLVELLSALEPHRPPDQPLSLHFPLGEERGAALAEVWAHHWNGFPLVIDAQRPGAPFEVGQLEVRTAPIRVGDPRWQPERVERRVGMAVRIGDHVAAVFGAAPDAGLRRWCSGVALAVVEVGVGPWPRAPEPWRLRIDQAVALGDGARELWVVGDDGSRLA